MDEGGEANAALHTARARAKLYNVIMLGFAFFLLFSAFLTGSLPRNDEFHDHHSCRDNAGAFVQQTVLTDVLNSPHLGFDSMAIVYAFFGAGSLFVSPL